MSRLVEEAIVIYRETCWMRVDFETLPFEFVGCYQGIWELKRQIAEMLPAAIESGRALRQAQAEARRIMADANAGRALFEALSAQSSLIFRSRPRALLNATAVIVSTWSVVEDLRFATGMDNNVHHGAVMNGIHFTELLWAAGNSTRHGHSWWRALMSALTEHVLAGHKPDDFDPAGHYDKRQVRSVAVLVQALELDWRSVNPLPDICYDALEQLSGGGSSSAFIARLYDVGAEIGSSSTEAKVAFAKAMAELRKGPPAFE